MSRSKRLLIAAALLALAGFAGQVMVGIATGTASQCGVANVCAPPPRK